MTRTRVATTVSGASSHRRKGSGMGIPRQEHPGAAPAPEAWRHDATRAGEGDAVRSEPRGMKRVHEPAVVRDLWYVLDRARTYDALAVAQDAVFRRYLPMARALAGSVDCGDRPGDRTAADRAAEIGLAQAVLGWRRPYDTGFELFAHIAIAAELDRLPVQRPGSAGPPPPGGPPAPGCWWRPSGWRRLAGTRHRWLRLGGRACGRV